jgi:hypothetical protein
MLEPRVLALGVLPDDDDVDVLVPGGQAGHVGAVDERGVEVELLAQLHVEGGDPAADGGGEPTLEADLVAVDGFDDGGWHGGHVAVDVVGLEVDGGVHRLHDLPHGARDEGSDAISRDERDGPRGAVPGPRHVGHGAARAAAVARERQRRGDEVAQERGGSPRHRGWVGSGIAGAGAEANCERGGGRRGGRWPEKRERRRKVEMVMWFLSLLIGFADN